MNELKDAILQFLCGQQLESLNTYCLSEIRHGLNVPEDKLFLAFESLQTDGFISDLNIRSTSDCVFCITNVSALEFIENGGYSAQNAFAELEKRKLRLEVELLTAELGNLKKTNPTLAERVISVLADLSAFAGLFT